MLVTNSAESGATAGDETTVTTVNSAGVSGTAWSTVTVDAGAACVFDNAQAAHGSWSYRQATGATAGQVMLIWGSTVVGTPARLYGRFYFRTSAIGLVRSLARVRSGATQVMRVQISSSGRVELRNTTSTLVVDSGAGNVLNPDTWYRIEFDCTPGAAGTCTIRVYVGDSTTLAFPEVTGSSNFGSVSTVNEVAFGNAGAAANLPTAWFDDLGISDTGWMGPATSAPLDRSTAEALTLAGSAAATVVRARAAGEAITVSDAWTYTAGRAAAAAAALTLTSSAGRSTAGGRAAGETLTLADVLSTARAGTRAVAEAISLVDAAARTTARLRTGADGMTFDDTATRTVARPRAVAESLTLVDALTSGRFTSIAVAETLTLVDGWQRATGYARVASEAVTLADVVARVLARAREVAEALGLVDAARPGLPPAFLTVAEEIAISEVATTVAIRSRARGETLTLADVTARRTSRPRAAGEAITLSAVFIPARLIRLSTSESLVIEDQAATALAKVRQLLETLTLADMTVAGPDGSRQPPVAYPHRVTVTSTPARVADTTGRTGSVRRTV